MPSLLRRVFSTQKKKAAPPVHRVEVDQGGRERVYVGPYELTSELLGHGGNSVVHRAIDTRSGEDVAIKCIPLSSAQAKRVALQGPSGIEEVRILGRLLHPNISRMRAALSTDTYMYLVMDRLQGTELFDLVKAEKHLEEGRAREIFAQLVSALLYLQTNRVLHLDLKLENVLVDGESNLTSLIDFGHSSLLDASPPLPYRHNTRVATLEYTAPEVLLFGESSPKSDVWSLGVVLYAMLCGHLPFEGATEQEVRLKITNPKPRFPKGLLSKQAKHLLRAMLCPEPASRLSLEEIKHHPWFLQGLHHYPLDGPL